MQSEINDIRKALNVLHMLNDCGRMTEDDAREGLAYIGEKLGLIEMQQAMPGGLSSLPVMRLEDIAREARQGRPAFRLIEGGRDA